MCAVYKPMSSCVISLFTFSFLSSLALPYGNLGDFLNTNICLELIFVCICKETLLYDSNSNHINNDSRAHRHTHPHTHRASTTSVTGGETRKMAKQPNQMKPFIILGHQPNAKKKELNLPPPQKKEYYDIPMSIYSI